MASQQNTQVSTLTTMAVSNLVRSWRVLGSIIRFFVTTLHFENYLVYSWWSTLYTADDSVSNVYMKRMQLTTSTSLNHKTRILALEVKSDCKVGERSRGGCQESWLMSPSVDNLVSKAPHNNLLVVISPPALPLVRTPSSHFIGPIRAENVSRNLSWTLAQICFIVCLLHFTHVSIGKESFNVNETEW